MDAGDAKSVPALGFLTVVEHPQYGLFGGYLVLNTAGRPLEFHCTSPIKPNRAQEILYGPTLQAFLYGEQIGRTLLTQTNTEPLVVCTDRPPALAAREFVATPVVLVLASETDTDCNAELPANASVDAASESSNRSGRFFRIDSAHQNGPRLLTFQFGRNRLALPEDSGDDRRQVADRLGKLAESFDLSEPFQRIREAIEEAQQAAK
jgi:hypothetical protein